MVVLEGLQETLKSLPKLLAEREKELEEREQEVERLKASLEKDHPNFGTPNDVLRLNIGGTRIDVLRRTLTLIEDSMLASRFSGRWDDSLEKDSDGNYFIDQPPELFVPLVNYLRAKASETQLARKVNPPTFEIGKDLYDFQRMADYYGLTLGVYPMGIYRLQSAENTNNPLVSGVTDYKIESEEWATYYVSPLDESHSRYIESYEVTVGKSSTVQIGWILLDNPYLTQYIGSETGRGVGYGTSSNSLDCVKSAMVIDGATTDLLCGTDVSVKDGSAVRCDKKGKGWYIDGILVASNEQETEDKVLSIKTGSASSRYVWVPCISIKGNCEISTIELEF